MTQPRDPSWPRVPTKPASMETPGDQPGNPGGDPPETRRASDGSPRQRDGRGGGNPHGTRARRPRRTAAQRRAEAPQTWRERRWARQAAADRARRRVRSTSGRPQQSKRPIVVQIGPSGRRGGRRRRHRGGGPGPATIAWLAVAMTLMTFAILLRGVVWITLAVLSLAVVAAVNRHERVKARSAAPPPPRRQRDPRENADRANGSGSSGARGDQRRRRGERRAGSEAVCSDACKISKRPKSTCRCRATHCEHGSKAGI